jgi:hypothetical protein
LVTICYDTNQGEVKPDDNITNDLAKVGYENVKLIEVA